MTTKALPTHLYKRNGLTYCQRRDSVNSFILLAFGFYLLMGSLKRNRFSGTLTQDPVCTYDYYAGHTQAGDRRIQRLPPNGFRSRSGQNMTPKGEKCGFICCGFGIVTYSEWLKVLGEKKKGTAALQTGNYAQLCIRRHIFFFKFSIPKCYHIQLKYYRSVISTILYFI